MEYTEKIVEIAKKAASKIMEFYEEEIDVEMKEDNSPLTKADLAANEVIVNELKENYPEIPILSEESADNLSRVDSELLWVVDPIDGTKEFIKKNGEFTVNIALVKKGTPVLGVVALPAKDRIYIGDDKGAYKEENGERTKITISETKKLSDAKVVRSRSHFSEDQQKVLDDAGITETIPSGSSNKGCLVADGTADIYPRLGRQMEWDIAAMVAVIESAGGKVTNLKGDELKFNKENPEVLGYLASNGKLHEEFLGLIRDKD